MTTIDDWAEALVRLEGDLAAASDTPELWRPPKAAFQLDLTAAQVEAPEWSVEGIFERVVWDSAKYVSLVRRHGLGVAALLREEEVFVSQWPVLRAQLEAAGRLAWILEPHDDGAGIGPRRRGARYFMELLCSVCYQREALKALGATGAADAKRLRTKAISEIERLFGITLAWSAPGSERNWQIQEDKYVSLASGARRFATHMVPDLKGIYPTLSGYAHPSLRFLDELLIEQSIEDERLLKVTWRASPDLIHWQCRVAGIVMYRASTLLFSYLGGPQDALERAMDRFEEVVDDSSA